ncbi:hypothetical protein A2960_03700 [Candidatus Gottesmanbacteria bacterium RIFCSPLOWO2_01_FULL_39_12b]|uniref:Uncharacterized protein n=1 Tax=Candidatus Gottesmanbacteria bacterium RIFCSPLOWO2_01_FULL_39_12b TaxID=1798388 RepID=A0A1F6APE7_9BACT|nr:MAG: hypothetical protein A2960_03700 [Candidatus Gottesmanbacteria bacterium RIFCSPLOWO2_01_FULL_39_12b]
MIIIFIIRTITIKSTVKNGLSNTIPNESGASVTPKIMIPTPISILRKISYPGIFILLSKKLHRLNIFIGYLKLHRIIVKVTLKNWQQIYYK